MQSRSITHGRNDHEHICLLAQLEQDVLAARILEIETDALLAARDIAKPYAVARLLVWRVPCRFAQRIGLDLDDLGTMIGHDAGEMWTRKEQRQIDNANACKLHGNGPIMKE